MHSPATSNVLKQTLLVIEDDGEQLDMLTEHFADSFHLLVSDNNEEIGRAHV